MQTANSAADTRPAPPLTAEEIIKRAEDLQPWLRERSDDIEAGRRLSGEVVEALRDTGVFGMAFPTAWGGPELTSSEQTRVIEALSYGDTSAGWCAMIGMDSGIYAGYLDEDTARGMFPAQNEITAGLIFPSGRADRVEGGYRLTGRWKFGSGITHCDWVSAGAFVYRSGEPEPSPAGAERHWRMFILPPTEVTVLDTWHTTGLSGSGSCDYEVQGVFVPESHTFSFGVPRSRSGPLSLPDAFVRNMPGVPLGTARAALDHFRAIARERTIAATGGRWADDYRIQLTLAECEMEFQAARHAVYGSLDEHWSRLATAASLDDLTDDQRIATMLPRVNSFRAARRIISRLYDLLATGAIYRPNPMDRWLRDITTMCQHIVVQDQIVQSAGAYLLGGDPQFPFSLGIVE
ncbi:acyl-CoA dehydrogenase family protein [Glycomyces arizonensis]|uniref:acyl-CoA dehydrogenase family protein n=1 Tax=Glycomyces arizonensis TaxID=256035 RepID=UPI0003FD5B38|nr:acyl-CoA dehydrogenase family protein [Glycomyces arizonensis]